MIKAKVIADSVNPFGNRITTIEATMPRYILAELNTHRVLSKNSASSRAIPFKKMVESVQTNPFVPYAWQKEHRGMQGTEYFEGGNVEHHKNLWLKSRDNAIKISTEMADDKLWPDRNLTKQLANRPLEAYMWHTVLITATEWENFFNLRCPKYAPYDENSALGHITYRSIKDIEQDLKDSPEVENGDLLSFNPDILARLEMNKGQADIHMMALAESIYDAIKESTPKVLQPGEWHTPYKEDILKQFGSELTYQIEEFPIMALVSSVMCARVSYTVPDHDLTEWTLKKYTDKALDLIKADPIHASPFEHNGKSMSEKDLDNFFRIEFGKVEAGWCRNFRGFIQLRAIIENSLRG